MKKQLRISPSILTSDFTRLGETIDMLNSSQCDYNGSSWNSRPIP